MLVIVNLNPSRSNLQFINRCFTIHQVRDPSFVMSKKSPASQVDPPDVQGRYEILKVHAKGKNLAPGVDLLAVARQTPGMSGRRCWEDG